MIGRLFLLALLTGSWTNLTTTSSSTTTAEVAPTWSRFAVENADEYPRHIMRFEFTHISSVVRSEIDKRFRAAVIRERILFMTHFAPINADHKHMNEDGDMITAWQLKARWAVEFRSYLGFIDLEEYANPLLEMIEKNISHNLSMFYQIKRDNPYFEAEDPGYGLVSQLMEILNDLMLIAHHPRHRSLGKVKIKVDEALLSRVYLRVFDLLETPDLRELKLAGSVLVNAISKSENLRPIILQRVELFFEESERNNVANSTNQIKAMIALIQTAFNASVDGCDEYDRLLLRVFLASFPEIMADPNLPSISTHVKSLFKAFTDKFYPAARRRNADSDRFRAYKRGIVGISSDSSSGEEEVGVFMVDSMTLSQMTILRPDERKAASAKFISISLSNYNKNGPIQLEIFHQFIRLKGILPEHLPRFYSSLISRGLMHVNPSTRRRALELIESEWMTLWKPLIPIFVRERCLRIILKGLLAFLDEIIENQELTVWVESSFKILQVCKNSRKDWLIALVRSVQPPLKQMVFDLLEIERDPESPESPSRKWYATASLPVVNFGSDETKNDNVRTTDVDPFKPGTTIGRFMVLSSDDHSTEKSSKVPVDSLSESQFADLVGRPVMTSRPSSVNLHALLPALPSGPAISTRTETDGNDGDCDSLTDSDSDSLSDDDSDSSDDETDDKQLAHKNRKRFTRISLKNH